MRAGRLLNLLLLLQAHRRMSATRLAAELEVSVRTVLRDIDELSASGVPVRAVRGAEGGFELLEGWRTRLTGLTPAEAQALFVAGAGGPTAQLGLADAGRTAQLKVLASLPQDGQADAHRVAARFHLDAVGWYRREETLPHLAAVAEAVWRERRLKLRYESWKGVVDRRIDPLGLVVKAGEWYLVARAEATIRTYKVANIHAVETGGPFKRPRGFDLERHWRESLARFEAGLYQGTATLRVTERGARALCEMSAAVSEAVSKSLGEKATKPPFVVTIPIESVDHAAGELLRFGSHCEVLSPPLLRERLASKASEVVRLYSRRRGRRAARLASAVRARVRGE